MQTILSFIFVLGVLIFVHELGHFLMARRIGVRVITFSLGFGPKLLSFRRGDTEYCLSAFPLGGYVKMAGENPKDAQSGAPDEYLSKTKWQRFQVLVMGPVMNLVLAVVVMTVVIYQGATVPEYGRQPAVVGTFTDDSVAKAAGVRPGDEIVGVDDALVANWDGLSKAIAGKAGRHVSLVVRRDTRMLTLPVVPRAKGQYELGDLGVQPIVHPEIGTIEPGRVAAEAGLRTGDVVLAADGQRGITQPDLIALIRRSADRPLVLDITRDGAPATITVTPRLVGATAMIGASIMPFEVRTLEPGLVEAFTLSAQRNWEWSTQVVDTLSGLFTRETSVKGLMGPIGIARVTGEAAHQGWLSLFTMMSLISLNLGLFNLMPIPVLDGGHITILLLEGVSRRQFSMQVKEKMILAGFALLLMLMVTVIYNDIARIASL